MQIPLRSMPYIDGTFAFPCCSTYSRPEEAGRTERQRFQRVGRFGKSILDMIRCSGMIRIGFADHDTGYVEATSVLGQQEGRLSSQEYGDKFEPD